MRDSGAPSILYVNGGSQLLEEMSSSGAGVLSIDWRTRLGEAREFLGKEKGLQGNLDPSCLFAEPAEVSRKANQVLDEMAGDEGFIFNLGHGVLRTTKPEIIDYVVKLVRSKKN